MKKEELVNEILRAAKENGLISALYGVYGRHVRVSVPFGKRACESSIDDIDFSPRANNSLKRAGVFTIGEIIDLIADGGLIRIRNLGKKTENEIKTRVLDFGFQRLSESEKSVFVMDLVERNSERNAERNAI